MPEPTTWDGHTYYGRPQVKSAPFNNRLVGSYVFLAGLSGAAQILATLIDLRRGRVADATVRRGRLLALLAPTIGTGCLILDLHTPKRFYNMLRVFKATSPMSLGSWALVGFGAASSLTVMFQFVANRSSWLKWSRAMARVMQIPASLTGGVLCTYTASLFSATSTPRWATAPKSLAVRYGAASFASAAAALSLGEGQRRRARDLDSIAITALAAELAATLGSDNAQRRADIADEVSITNAISIAVPIALFTLSLLLPRRSRFLSSAASLAALGGSLAMRIGVMEEGDDSARRPEISMRFAQPKARVTGVGTPSGERAIMHQ